MQLRMRLLASGLTIVLFLGAVASYSQTEGPGAFIVRYLSPLPDSRYVLPATNIIIRTDKRIGADAANRLVRNITGSRTGIHPWTLRVSDDGHTVLCQPVSPFGPGENVAVQVDTGAARWAGPAAAGQFTFSISGQTLDPVALRKSLRAAEFPPSVSARGRDAGKMSSASSGQPDLPNISVTLSTPTSPGNLFLSNQQWSVPTLPALLIIRNDGTPVFARELAGNAHDFKPQPNGTLTYYDDYALKFYVMDSSCTIIDSITCGNGYDTDPHELRLFPNGHALLLGVDDELVDMSALVTFGSPIATVAGYVIQELDQNRNVVFQWRSWDHYNILDAENIDLTAEWIDYVHGNAIDVDTDGNLLFSSRHLNEITKIDRGTGDIIWRLGGMNNQFTFVNDTLGFSYQHAVRRIANGDITLMDNGDFHDPPFSRALEYALDEQHMTATLVWQFRNTPDVFGFAMGYVQRMENGNTLIGWGAGNPSVTEVSPNGTKLFEMSFDDGIYSYRALRSEWQPVVTSSTARTTPVAFGLSQNYPNPFNPSTTIQFSVARQSHVRLEVFNLLGQHISTIVDDDRAPGVYSARFDGARLASGVYLYRLEAGTFSATKRLILLH